MEKQLIPRLLDKKLKILTKQFPAIAILGPRQSGKTTLAKKLFKDYSYVNLELFSNREFAREDPVGFLNQYQNKKGVILDEIQNAPDLFSYLQVQIDANERPGYFILTGSQNILLNSQISQTLAGRIALTTLLPLSIKELKNKKILPLSLADALFQGFYPRVYQSSLDPVVFADSYIRTYIERDVRDLKNISSLSEFQKFMKLCAARTGQLLNMSALANESGLNLSTVKSWLSILEASYVIFLLQPYHKSFNKRLVKMPKLYFIDTALACSLLRITKPDEIYAHPLRGALFESMVIADFLKTRFEQALPSNLYFWRDKLGNEIDCLQEEGPFLKAYEIKSGETLNTSMFEGLIKWSEISQNPLNMNTLIYGGKESQKRKMAKVSSWLTL